MVSKADLTPHTASATGAVLAWTELETELGWASIATSRSAICALILSDHSDPQGKKLSQAVQGAALKPAGAARAHQNQQWIRTAIARLVDETLEPLPLAVVGSPFDLETWRHIQLIPPGETRSYQQLAQAMNRSSAVRAVASACGRNRHALLIPCHRVVRSDGGLGGYRWQLERKARILTYERDAALAQHTNARQNIPIKKP